MWRSLALTFAVAVFAISGVRAQEFVWTNGEGDGLFSTGGNWANGAAPTSPAPTLYFQASGTAVNDLTGLQAEALSFSGDGTVVSGQAFSSVWRVEFSDSSTPGTNTVDVGLAASGFGFSTTTFEGQHLRFTQELAMNDVTYLFFNGGSLNNSVSFAGASGALTTTSPAIAQVLGATVAFDNSEAVNTARWSAGAQLNLRTNGRVRLIGNEAADVTQELASVKAYTSDILEVQNVGTTSVATLQVGQLELTEGAVLLHRSTGGANQVLGSADGPQIIYAGQGDSDFLGPQMFYLSGDLEGGNATVEYAAYDAETGVVSATTDVDNVETVNDATANVLQTTSNTFFSGTSTMHSLAYNAGSLYDGGDGAMFNLTHLLMGPTAGTLGVALNFGDRAGSITSEVWGSRPYKDTYLSGNIQGSNELTFRGSGYFHLMGESTFSGTVKIAGAFVALEFSGQLANVAAIELGDEGRTSRLDLLAGANRLADEATILVKGDAELNAYAEPGTGAASEEIGDITVAMESTEVFNNRRFTIWVRTYGVDDPSSPMALSVGSLAFGETVSNNRVDLIVEGSNSSLSIGGPAIEVKNGNMLNVNLKSAGTRIALAGGVSIAEGEDGTVELSAGYEAEEAFQAVLEADLDLQGGTLNLMSDHGLLALDGDLTMGEMLETYLYLNAAEESAALIAIDGDLTLDGTVFVSSNLGYVEGTWLLFSVTGTILDEGWSIEGLDGSYYYYRQGGNVYLTTNAVPEPSTWMLLGLGAVVVGVRVWRRRGVSLKN